MSWTVAPTKCDCSGRQPVEWRKVARRSTVDAYKRESALISLKTDFHSRVFKRPKQPGRRLKVQESQRKVFMKYVIMQSKV